MKFFSISPKSFIPLQSSGKQLRYAVKFADVVKEQCCQQNYCYIKICIKRWTIQVVSPVRLCTWFVHVTLHILCKYSVTRLWPLIINTPFWNVVLLPLLLTLNIFHSLFRSFYCWFWTSKCLLGKVSYRNRRNTGDFRSSYLKAWNFIKERYQHRCSPVNIAKFLRTSILKNICKRLLQRLSSND